MNGCGAGHADDVLRQHVEPARPRRSPSSSRAAIASSAARHSSTSKRLAGDEQGAARLVEPVIGAADALHQARHALGRADLDDEIDVAPIDAEIERRGRDHRAQLARRHRRLDLAALLDGQDAVMQRDRQIVVVEPPQLLEHELGLGAGVDEDDRWSVAADHVVDLGPAHRPPIWPAQGRRSRGVEDRRPGAARPARPSMARPRLPPEPSHAASSSGQATVADRPTRRACGASARQPRQAERQEIAALGAGERVQLVDDDAAQAGEDLAARRGRRAAAPAIPAWSSAAAAAARAGAGGGSAACRRCGSRAAPAAPSRRSARRGCAGCRPPAPSAARCRACAAPACGAARPARSGWAGTRRASCRRRSARSAARSSLPRRRPSARAGAACGVQPAPRTSRRSPAAAAARAAELASFCEFCSSSAPTRRAAPKAYRAAAPAPGRASCRSRRRRARTGRR